VNFCPPERETGGVFRETGRGEIGIFTLRILSPGEIFRGRAGENLRDFYFEESP